VVVVVLTAVATPVATVVTAALPTAVFPPYVRPFLGRVVLIYALHEHEAASHLPQRRHIHTVHLLRLAEQTTGSLVLRLVPSVMCHEGSFLLSSAY
jgi:hypothetical protein